MSDLPSRYARRPLIDDLLAERDKVVARITGRGTHADELMGIPATHKPVAMTGIAIYRFAHGKTAERWAQHDTLSLLQQLGVLPPMGHGGA